LDTQDEKGEDMEEFKKEMERRRGQRIIRKIME
jgi:hypothetical protein